MTNRSYYEVLGIDATADLAAIKAAYRKLAFDLHPDRNDSEEALGEFYQVKNAYEALTDPIRREAYDELRRIKRQQAATAKPAPVQPKPPTVEDPVPPARGPSRASPDELVKLTALLTRGRFAEAERMARKMITQSVSHPIPYAVLGDIAKMRGDLTYAAEMYAYAVQLDSRNLIYQRKHDEALARVSHGSRRIATLQPAANADNSSMLIASVIVLFACIAVILGTDLPIASDMPMIGTWTWTLVAMLCICGLTLGACLSFAGMMSRFSTLLSGIGDFSISPSVVVSGLSVLNLWVGALAHCFLGITHRNFDLSTTRIVGGAALITLLLSGASAAQGQIDYLQTFFWGGNLVFGGALLGWLGGDAYLEETGRLK